MVKLLQFALQLDQDLEALLIQHGPLAYAIVAAAIFCSVGVLPLVFVPADMLLFLSGALCALGVLRVAWLAPLVLAAALAGTLFNYGVARALASVWRPKPRRWFDAVSARTRALYARHGAVLLLYSPFIAIVRAGAPAIAGATRMPLRRFARFAGGGVAIWVLALGAPGYFFGNVPWVRAHLPAAMALVIAALVLAFGARALWRHAHRKHRTRGGGAPPPREPASRRD